MRFGSSKPTKSFLPASTALSSSSSEPLSARAYAHACGRLRAAISSPAITSSLTALAFAPGVLKTGMPSLLSFATGMLFVPAPARPTHSTLSGIGMSCILNERSKIASGLPISAATS